MGSDQIPSIEGNLRILVVADVKVVLYLSNSHPFVSYVPHIVTADFEHESVVKNRAILRGL